MMGNTKITPALIANEALHLAETEGVYYFGSTRTKLDLSALSLSLNDFDGILKPLLDRLNGPELWDIPPASATGSWARAALAETGRWATAYLDGDELTISSGVRA